MNPPRSRSEDPGAEDLALKGRAPDGERPHKAYHHGDLRAALLDAAETELGEHGIEGFSLRGVTKRAAVSHAAPAHHFRDVTGLLTALAARGFERFLARQQDFQREAAAEPRAQLEALGIGYVNFALENPALFRLMFGSDRTNYDDPELRRHAEAAFFALVNGVVKVTTPGTLQDSAPPPAALLQAAGSADVAAAWALAHGLADLMVAGRLPWLTQTPAAQRNRAIAALLTRSLP
ncbi:MAG: TetR/AcrR family transcriptional regulator [Betaproteobacteria bacterium]|jgi:AcrR family transcriptional regulator